MARFINQSFVFYFQEQADLRQIIFNIYDALLPLFIFCLLFNTEWVQFIL